MSLRMETSFLHSCPLYQEATPALYFVMESILDLLETQQLVRAGISVETTIRSVTEHENQFPPFMLGVMSVYLSMGLQGYNMIIVIDLSSNNR
jgi:hypothetical protein